MIPPPEFSSLIVSRRRAGARVSARLRGLALGTALYAIGIALLVLSPVLVLEVMPPPRAGIAPPVDLVFRPPSGHGDNRPAGPLRKGVRDGRKDATVKTAPILAPAHDSPRALGPMAPPPEMEFSAAGGPIEDGPSGTGPFGDPQGVLNGTAGGSGACPSCTGHGPEGPGVRGGPYEQGTEGLVPPSLIPGTRALPSYPDLARRAGLQGSVILLVVIEPDGTVGEIEVVRNADQRFGFDLAAIEAVKRWRYQPALMNGRPVAAYIQVMVEFSLAR